jgi:RNA polymerase primary sigma factor
LKNKQRTIVAVFSALKNKAKGKKVAAKPAVKKTAAKKAVAKKAVVKKAPAKKAAPVKKVAAKPTKPIKASKPVKVEVKKELSVKEIQQLVDLKSLVARQKEIVESLEASGIDNYRKAVKKEFMALALEARQLDIEIPVATEKARKAGLGAPSRILSKAQLALIAPKEDPKPTIDAKAAKAAVVLDEDGNEIVVEEVELEDVETLIAEASEIIDAEADGKDQPQERGGFIYSS